MLTLLRPTVSLRTAKVQRTAPLCRAVVRAVAFKGEPPKPATPVTSEPLQSPRPQDVAPLSLRRFGDMLAEMQTVMDSMTDDISMFPSLRPRSGLFHAPLQRGLGLLSAPFSAMETDTSWALNPANVVETNVAYTITIEVPGFGKDDIQVKLSRDGVLSLVAERKSTTAPAEEESKPVEEGKEEVAVPAAMSHSHRRFSRTFRLPRDVMVDDIKASAENGILTITVPRKLVEEEVKEIPVEGV